MATGTVSSVSGDVWQLISSVTPTNGATSVTFSSVSGYKTIMVAITGIVTSASEAMFLQFNGDTTAGDYYANAAGIQLGRTFTAGGPQGRIAIVYDVDKSVPHRVDTTVSPSSSEAASSLNVWTTASPITSFTFAFLTSATFTAAGTIALYGIAA
jgi:hypothetical protein